MNVDTLILLDVLKRRPQKGFTLIEAAIVLAIIGLVAGGIWVSASSVYENLRTSRASEQLLYLVQKVRSLHATQGGVAAGSMTTALAQAKVFPSDMFDSATDTTPANPWQGSVTVEGSADGQSFQVIYTSLPVSSCIDIVTRNTGVSRDGGLLNVQVNSSGLLAPPISVDTVAPNCTATSEVRFFFTLRGVQVASGSGGDGEGGDGDGGGEGGDGEGDGGF